MSALTDLSSPAKLNLFLHVTGRRPDGYHLLESVFVPLDWCDTLHVETRHDGQLRRHDHLALLPADDLCLQAARKLQRHARCTLGADIHVHKRLPWGAGLGGGSSNAATVLKALDALWHLHLDPATLLSLAAELGADVPFFMVGRPAWVRGIGEIVEPIDLPPGVLNTPVAVLKPPVCVPTPAIFGSPQLRRNTPHATVSAFLAEPKRFGHNDLQGPAQAHSSEVTQALASMQSHFGNSRMTGSGSAVFSWVEPDTTANPARFSAADLGLCDDTWVGRMCHLLPAA